MTIEQVTAHQRALDFHQWRTALDPSGVAHHEAWATLDLLSALWQPRQATSLLTPSGAPLEFTFRGDRDTLAYTAEPGQPTYSPHTKWSVIRALTSSIGAAPRGRPGRLPTISMARKPGGHGGPPLPGLVPMLRQQPGQRFGCWLGVRQGSGAASYKVYQEVPPAAREQALSVLRTALPALDPGISLVPQLVGQALPSGAIEFYLHIPDPRPATLHALLHAANAAEQAHPCSEHLAWLTGLPVSQLRERLRLGLSYRLSPEQPPIVSLFVHAVQISERNAPVRTRLLELAAQLDVDFTRYARATAFLQGCDPPSPLHGLIGLTIEPTNRLSISAGVSPPFHLSSLSPA